MAKPVKYPDNIVSYIITTYTDHTATQGTGVLITPDEVLTTAHMVADNPIHGKVISVSVIPAQNGTEQPSLCHNRPHLHRPCFILAEPGNAKQPRFQTKPLKL